LGQTTKQVVKEGKRRTREIASDAKSLPTAPAIEKEIAKTALPPRTLNDIAFI